MEVLRTTELSDKAAAKVLKKFVESKEGEENTDLMMNEEVKSQLTQVLAHLEGKKIEIQPQIDEYQYGAH
ncbi:hypothetical protein BBO99_00000841 [Phytophthora kernoviae]|uniref:Uncharacterized protein n=2 Tax=Phytophthora kernoviae TaxID=325452 RepID=A0A3R7KAV1_9STRA|nr:hypothetical protein G195_001566 [Phytophthora kernoviae 00238/432]KAG2531833.1 hypothetical protein JM16_000666 [Phytophthora kernoviae]KAG2532705.1 hypothetical protein JM18_000748 [Phytophthora kernoviae]RLN44386.1 hypothetical protein BBI17_000979 [Phytophthora kernoviae]RLN85011.1 hypothetical protein BBO99_00000841 [Phytophthora kernoviae]